MSRASGDEEAVDAAPCYIQRACRVSDSSILLPVAIAILASTPHAAPQGRQPGWAGAPGARVLLDAHNCYPDGGQWTDRIDRALATGLPVAIEQDLVWFRDPRSGVSRSILSHGEPFTGTEPSLATHFFERIRPLVEQALRDGRRETWPLIVLNLDLKTNEPEHHAAIWETLGTYDDVADDGGARRRWHPPGAARRQAGAGADRQPRRAAGGLPRSRPGRRAPARVRRHPRRLEAKVGKGKEAIPKLAGLSPAELIASGATNYRRWVNFPWAVVERGGQAEAGAWTPADAARLAALSALAHSRGLWIRFYTLNGHAAADDRGWTASYNFGSPAAVETRWRAARDAGVDFIATDQYEGLARVLARPAAAGGARRPRPRRLPPPTQRPGVQGRGVTLLPNGWRIAPAGRHLQAGDFPLAMTATPGRPLPGHHQQRLLEADADRGRHRALGDQGQGAGRARVARPGVGRRRQAALLGRRGREHRPRLRLRRRRLKQGTPLVVAPPAAAAAARHDRHGRDRLRRRPRRPRADGKTLYAVHVFGRAISAIDLATRRACARPSTLPAEPYTVLPAADGRRVFVSLWGGAKVLALDAATLAVDRRGRGRRAPERDGAVEGRPAPVRRLREHQQGLGDRHRRR